MLTDSNAMYSTLYDMKCWIRCNFVIKTTGTKISALIESISKRSNYGIWRWMDEMSMNQHLQSVIQFKIYYCHYKILTTIYLKQ